MTKVVNIKYEQCDVKIMRLTMYRKMEYGQKDLFPKK